MPVIPRAPRPGAGVRFWVVLAVLGVLAVGYSVWSVEPRTSGSGNPVATVPPVVDAGSLRFERVSDPGRTVVRDARGTVAATFTDGARTVAVAGPLRTFAEPRTTHAAVETTIWVRLAPQPWAPEAERSEWVLPWLRAALADTTPDVLAIAMEYLPDAPEQRETGGTRFAGNASFGPETGGGKRAEASDFYDYLGVPWQFADGVSEQASRQRYGAVDCSGFIRLVYGYRSGYPLLGENVAGAGLPRRAYAMAELGPGALIVPDQGGGSAGIDRLQSGDLLFFVTDGTPGLDHSAIYLGVDSDGERRFVSSRSSPDGPTMGDVNGASTITGGGFYAERFRTARRV